MLDEFGNELENTDSKLDSTMKKVAKVLHMSNGESVIKTFLTKHQLRNFLLCRSPPMDRNYSVIDYTFYCDNFIYCKVIPPPPPYTYILSYICKCSTNFSFFLHVNCKV